MCAMKAAIIVPPYDPGPVGERYRATVAAQIPLRARRAAYNHATIVAVARHALWDTSPEATRERRVRRTEYLKQVHATAWLTACDAAKVPEYWTGTKPLPTHWPVLPADCPEVHEDARIAREVRQYLFPALDRHDPFLVAAYARETAMTLARLRWVRQWLERLADADTDATAAVWGIRAAEVPVIRSAAEALIYAVAEAERQLRDPRQSRVESVGPCVGAAVNQLRKRRSRTVLHSLAGALARHDPPSATAWRPVSTWRPLCDDEGLSVPDADAGLSGWSFAYRSDWSDARASWVEAIGRWIGQCVRSVVCDAAGVPLPWRSPQDDKDSLDTWRRGVGWPDGLLTHNMWVDVRLHLSRGGSLPAWTALARIMGWDDDEADKER